MFSGFSCLVAFAPVRPKPPISAHESSPYHPHALPEPVPSPGDGLDLAPLRWDWNLCPFLRPRPSMPASGPSFARVASVRGSRPVAAPATAARSTGQPPRLPNPTATHPRRLRPRRSVSPPAPPPRTHRLQLPAFVAAGGARRTGQKRPRRPTNGKREGGRAGDFSGPTVSPPASPRLRTRASSPPSWPFPVPRRRWPCSQNNPRSPPPVRGEGQIHRTSPK